MDSAAFLPFGPIGVVAVLGLLVSLSEWLVRHTFLRHLGSALLVIVLTAIAANVGLIPTGVEPHPVYDAVFRWLAPLAIFWLLLRVHLRGLVAVGRPLLILFLVGAAGTLLGVLLGVQAVGGRSGLGEFHNAIAGMFVGTYVGGSVNFNAVALEYGVAAEGTLFAAATVVDAAMTALWMAACVALPRLLASRWPTPSDSPTQQVAAPITGVEDDTESVHPMELGLLLFLGAGSVGLSNWLARATGAPSVLILSTLALVLGQVGPVRHVRGARTMGMFAVLLFLAVIGALCDIPALASSGTLGAKLALMVTIAIAVHAAFVFGAAWILRLDPVLAGVASQANIGGGTSALALARSLGRPDLVLPSILVGSLGTALGTFLGFTVAGWLG